MKLGDVTLVKGCMICHEEVILLARRDARGELPEKGSIMPQVCDECKGKYLDKGVLLINPDNGNFVVLKDEAFKRIFNEEIPPQKIAFTDDELLDKFQVAGIRFGRTIDDEEFQPDARKGGIDEKR